MALLTPENVYRLYETMGVPESGKHEPKKAEIIQLLNLMIETSGAAVSRATLADLQGVTPAEDDFPRGEVLNDPNPINNGWYAWDGDSWVYERGFPDTFAALSLSGPPNAQIGTAAAGVNPSDVLVFFAVVDVENTGAMTLSISGGPARAVVNAAGNPLSAGEWSGSVIFFLNEDDEYQLLFDPIAVALSAANVTAAQELRDETQELRNQAEAFAALSGPVGVYPQSFEGDGVETEFALTVAPISAAHLVVAIDGVLQDLASYSVNDTTLIFTQAPPSSSNEDEPENIFVRIIAISNGEEVPPDGSVGTPKLADTAVTLAKLQNIATKKLIGRNTAGTGVPELIDFTAAGLAILQAATVAVQVAALGLTRVTFSANKNASDQGSIAVNTLTKITFGTEAWDIGGFYDAATSRFTPVAGKYRLSATVHLKTPTDGYRLQVSIYKNGAAIKHNYVTSAVTANSSVSITSDVDADGDDYFEIYATVLGASGTFTADGAVANSWFEGEAI